MKTFFIVAAILAVGFGASIQDEDVIGRSIIDPLIKAILEGIKPKLANLTIQDVNETFVSPNLNVSILLENIKIKNADKFDIKQLKSNLLPLKLMNLTLTWENLDASAGYDVNISLDLPQLKSPINVYGKGKARASLKKLFFTIGANMEMKDKYLQIKPKGLFGFDVRVQKANVSITSLMGNEDLGSVVSALLSKIIPGFVDDIKKPLFDTFHDDIVRIINEVLRKNGTTFSDDEILNPLEFGRLPFLDLSNELLDNLPGFGKNPFDDDF